MFQYSGVILALVGLIVAVYMKLNTPHFNSTHAKFGLAVMIVGVLQPLNAFIRPKPGAEWRSLWSFAHKNMGYAAVLAAVPTIYLGLLIANAPDAYAYVYFAVATALFLFYAGKYVVALCDEPMPARRSSTAKTVGEYVPLNASYEGSAGGTRSVSKDRAERVSQLRDFSTDGPAVILIQDDSDHES